MKISPALLGDLLKCAESLDSDTNPKVIAAHGSWLREIADKVEAEADQFETEQIAAQLLEEGGEA